MSGLVKGVKKVFRKVGRFVKKYWKAIVIAVAVYFTAGIALGAFASTASFSAAMPGFGAGGMFSKAAVAMGFQGAAGSGIAATAAGAAAAGGAGLGTVAATGTKIAGVGTPTAAQMATLQAGGSLGTATAGQIAANTAAQAAGTAVGGAAYGAANTGVLSEVAVTGVKKAVGTTAAKTTSESAILKSMSWANKLNAVNTAVKTIGGFMQDSDEEKLEKQQDILYQNAFGVGRDGNSQYGFSSSAPSAFSNMNKRPNSPNADTGSAFAKGASQFLSGYNSPTAQQMNPIEEAGQTEFIEEGYQRGSYLPG